jgi:hypothetical protein
MGKRWGGANRVIEHGGIFLSKQKRSHELCTRTRVFVDRYVNVFGRFLSFFSIQYSSMSIGKKTGTRC